VLVLDTAGAAVAGRFELARPIVTANAATEPKTSPRFARAARRRAMLIGMDAMGSYGITHE